MVVDFEPLTAYGIIDPYTKKLRLGYIFKTRREALGEGQKDFPFVSDEHVVSIMIQPSGNFW